MAYKQIDERFWKDKKVKLLSKDGYLFFLYLLTSPHTHFTGMSEMSLDYVNIDTPLTEKESKKAFKELMALELIDYDKSNQIVWIKNMHKYHVKSSKHIKGAETHINALPKSILCFKLAEILQIPYRYPIDTLSQVENTLSASEKYPIDTLPIQVEVKVEEKVKKAKAMFNEFWNIYPLKKNKKYASDIYIKLITNNESLHLDIMKAIPLYTADAIKQGISFAHASSWLNAERWEDEYQQPKLINAGASGIPGVEF